MNIVLPLHEIRDEDRRIVGGKGFALADMLKRDMAVPPGLCVTTHAYTEYLAAGQLKERILMELNRKAFEEMRWEELWDAALRIENLFVNTPLPGRLSEVLYGAFNDVFGDRAVVVRSSALGEDTSSSSFAGLHESYVNVKGPEAILDHVRRVWASLWSDRALLYRQELNLEVEASAMAVVVQEMVTGDRSGVVFGRNPNDPSQAVIEAVYGLNQGLVDGTVMPDRWILDRDTGRLVSHLPGDRKQAIVPVPEGIRLENLPTEKANAPPLCEDDIEAVFDLSRAAETVFGEPQDAEWTFIGDTLYVLQSRPVTSPPSSPDDDKRPWYLSLKKSFETLKKLRRKIEDERLPEMGVEADSLAAQDLASLTDGALTEEIERRWTINQKWAQIYEAEFIPMAHGMRLFGQVYNSTVRPADPYEFMSLLGTDEMVSIRRNGMLEALAEMIRQDPGLSAQLKNAGTSTGYEAFETMLDGFTDAFGDLSCGTDQCVTGQHVIIKLLLEMARRPPASQRFTQSDFQGLKDKFLSHFPAEQRIYAEGLLDIGRASYRLRDDDNIYVGKIKGQLDRAVREGLDRIEAFQRIGNPATEEFRRLEAVVKRHIPLLQKSGVSSVSVDAGPVLAARQLVGQPAGPGIGSGVAQVVREASELIQFEAGKVLVCDALDPTMTFVVPLCEGIVERRGGMLIHGAIIAREYGLPCVTGVPNAASVIKTGDRITVDGYLGIVTIHHDEG